MTPDSPLAPILRDLAAERQALAAAVERVPPALRDRRPAPDRWSVAEVLEHLSIIERRVVGLLEQKGAAAPARGAAPAAVDAGFERAAMLDRTRLVDAPEAIRPTGGLDARAAWAALDASSAALRATLERLDDRDLTGIGRDHPILGPINGYQWIAALGGHEARHAAQVEEIGAQLAGRA